MLTTTSTATALQQHILLKDRQFDLKTNFDCLLIIIIIIIMVTTSQHKHPWLKFDSHFFRYKI